MAYTYRGTIHDLDTPVVEVVAPVFDPSQCGTTRGHKQHRKFSESPCRPCKDAYNAYYRDLNVRRKNGLPHPAFSDDKCGTLTGYKRHRRYNVPVCSSCRDVRNEYQREAYNRKRVA